ncbi:MAG: deoxyguanosinetriphosphate triphosphohydrolase [Chloroflexi bacterium]|nr:deoxyguanosinetriphosphate triphosphohydrolase [Chloroflexota bacterium]MCL5110329.1 deoxyguanosinetriphosphate triphosphohydrolase [Chloroflexota bacterium]
MIHSHIRERIEEGEFTLSPLAAKSRYARGRARPEDESPMRSAFQRDRDRIVHCKAFRRLKYKTQVFLAWAGDHYSTRLTHTMEVAQVGRSLARALNLNEDLVEAISLAHDLGHTPFGHAGEEVLDRLFSEGFHHSEQSLRVVDLLEHEGEGLNLTAEVLDGVLHHSKVRSGIELAGRGFAHTVEGQVARLADSIAYLNHDLGDAVRAGVLREEEVPAVCRATLGTRHSQRINTMVCDAIDHSWEAVRAAEQSAGQSRQECADLLAAVGEAAQDGRALVAMGPRVLEATNALREFLFVRVYRDSPAKAEEKKVQALMERLYQHFCARPQAMPEEFRRNPRGETPERLVCDYLAGMTDMYAVRVFQDLYLPRAQPGYGFAEGPPVD